MNTVLKVLIAYGKIYDLADIHNMFDVCDIKFDFDNTPYIMVDGIAKTLTPENLSFITPLN